MTTKIIDKREIQTAADLLRFIQEVEAVGYNLDTMYLHTTQSDVTNVSLVEERLSDRSLVWNLALAS